MSFRTSKIAITILCAFTGILMTWIWNSNKLAVVTPNDALVQSIQSLEQSNDTYQNQIAKMQENLQKYQESLTSGKSHLSQLQQQLDFLKMQAGLTDVNGPGIVIYLNDNTVKAKDAMQKNEDIEQYLIHDKNLLDIVSELRLSGAEAIAINDQRIVSKTEIRCVGPAIMVNGTRLAAPYIISVIGNSDNLATRMETGTYNMLAQAHELPVQLTKKNNLTIAAFKGSYSYNFTQPVVEKTEVIPK